MRCPECEHTQKYKDGTRCGRCHYQFVFHKSDHKVSDYIFRQIINRLSDSGQYAFTATQLALEICRHWRKAASKIMIPIIILSILAVVFFMIDIEIVAFIFIAIIIVILLIRIFKTPSLPFNQASDLIHQYHQIYPIKELADGTAFQRQDASIELKDPHYAPERILVVERDDMVDMLIRNRFHLSAKAIVISASGYPNKIVEACQEFLRNHPNTPVQLLHDASPQGFNLHTALTSNPHWALAAYPLTDLGISQSTLQGDTRLPWLPAKREKKGVFSTKHTKMLSKGRRVPADYMMPKLLLSWLGAAVVSGVLMLIAVDALSQTGAEFGYEDYG